MAKNTIEPIHFKLNSISTDDFSSVRENFNAEETFDLVFGFNLGADEKNKVLILSTQFDFIQNENTYMNLKSSCSFEIESDNWNKILSHEKLNLPSPFLTHLLVICVGTARGIIHELKPQWAKNVLLPTIDISEFITDDIQLEINKTK